MESKKMRAQSQAAADKCEQAQEEICHCRCHGAAHGRKGGAGGGYFENLSPTDPHFVPSDEYKRDEKRKQAEILKARKYLVYAQRDEVYLYKDKGAGYYTYRLIKENVSYLTLVGTIKRHEGFIPVENQE